MHKLLRRQIDRYLAEGYQPADAMARLCDVVSRAYDEADSDRALLEHAMEQTSLEMTVRYPPRWSRSATACWWSIATPTSSAGTGASSSCGA